jgi:hypothetical protein
MRTATVLGCVVVALGLSACVSWSDPFERERALTLAQKRYTEALRWGDIDVAVRYVEPSLRDEFLSFAHLFETVKITDYEIGDLDIAPGGMERAEVDVSFHGYVMPHYVENRVRDHQVWIRDVEGDGDWHVQPELAALLAGLGAKPRR